MRASQIRILLVFSFIFALGASPFSRARAGWDEVADPIRVAKAVADRELFGRIISSDAERPPIRVHHNLNWEDATLMAGVFALYERTEELGSPAPRYLDYLEAYAARDPGGFPVPIIFGDLVCAGQTYIWLYERSGRTSEHLARTDGMVEFLVRDHFEPNQLFTPYHDYWMRFWQDDLHMIPPFLAMRGRAAGNRGIPGGLDARQVAMIYCRAYYEVLADRRTGLYWHNPLAIGRYHWGRGNGWVAAGFLKVMRVLEADPAYAADVAWLKQQLLEMAATLKANRNVVGTWNADVINRAEFSAPETSGSVFFTYLIANLVNGGELPPDYQPTVLKAWNFLRLSVQDNGFLMRVQPVGTRPIHADFELLTETYGIGGFLLAAVEISKMPEAAVATSGEIECVRLETTELSLAGDRVEISMAALAAKRADFPKAPAGKVQAVIPGERLIRTTVNVGEGKIELDKPASAKAIYLFYQP